MREEREREREMFIEFNISLNVEARKKDERTINFLFGQEFVQRAFEFVIWTSKMDSKFLRRRL
jgi:hypothetical protein